MEAIEFGSWKGETCFILGGGPSLPKVLPDPRVLKHSRVIATNNAYRLTPRAEILHFADGIWWDWHKESLPQEFKGRWMTTGAQSHTWRYWEKIGVHLFKKESNNGLSKSTSMISGSNAGHQAINIAVFMKVKTIVLIGFDMHATAKETHWHTEHKRPTNRSSYGDVMIPGMKSLVEPLKKLDIGIFNTNKDSAITCFPFKDIEDFLS